MCNGVVQKCHGIRRHAVGHLEEKVKVHRYVILINLVWSEQACSFDHCSVLRHDASWVTATIVGFVYLVRIRARE